MNKLNCIDGQCVFYIQTMWVSHTDTLKPAVPVFSANKRF